MIRLTMPQMAAYGRELEVSLGLDPSMKFRVSKYYYGVPEVRLVGNNEEVTRRMNRKTMPFDLLIPHLRSMENLSKKITVNGYNQNQPFTPINEIFMIKYGQKVDLTDSVITICYGDGSICVDGEDWIDVDYKVIDLLHLWKFNYRAAEAHEIIDQNNEILQNRLRYYDISIS